MTWWLVPISCLRRPNGASRSQVVGPELNLKEQLPTDPSWAGLELQACTRKDLLAARQTAPSASPPIAASTSLTANACHCAVAVLHKWLDLVLLHVASAPDQRDTCARLTSLFRLARVREFVHDHSRVMYLARVTVQGWAILSLIRIRNVRHGASRSLYVAGVETVELFDCETAVTPSLVPQSYAGCNTHTSCVVDLMWRLTTLVQCNFLEQVRQRHTFNSSISAASARKV